MEKRCDVQECRRYTQRDEKCRIKKKRLDDLALHMLVE